MIFYTCNLLFWCILIRTNTYCSVRVGGDAQCFLQAAAVLVHSQGKVPVAFVHSCHPFFDLPSMTVAFITETVSQLDQQLHTLLGLLRKREKTVSHARTH